jgi:hypothetical protein
MELLLHSVNRKQATHEITNIVGHTDEMLMHGNTIKLHESTVSPNIKIKSRWSFGRDSFYLKHSVVSVASMVTGIKIRITDVFYSRQITIRNCSLKR